MDHNNILAVVLAGGKSKRFGDDKTQAQLGGNILIDYSLSQIVNKFNEVLIVANDPIKHLSSDKIVTIENLFDLSNNIANIRLYEVWQIR